MYEHPVDNSNPVFFQGDVIDDFPFIFFETRHVNMLRNSDGAGEPKKFEIEKVNAFPVPNTADHLIAVEARRQKVVILSQTCDIQERNTIIVGPVFDITTAILDGRMSEGQATSLRNRKPGYWFYLPKLDHVIEESYIDFQVIQYFPKSLIVANLANRSLAMDHWGRHHLGWALSAFFGRPIKAI